MSQQVLDDMPLPDRSQRWVVVFVLASLALHGVGLLALSWMKDRPAIVAQKPVELVMIEVQKPPPPPPPPPEEEPKPKPPPRSPRPCGRRGRRPRRKR